MSKLRELIDEVEIKRSVENDFDEIDFVSYEEESHSMFSFELNVKNILFYMPKQKKFYKASRKSQAVVPCEVCKKKGYSILTKKGNYKCKEYLFEFESKKYAQTCSCVINYDFKEVELEKRTMLALLLSKKCIITTGEYLLTR